MMRAPDRIRFRHLQRQAEGYLELGMGQHALAALDQLSEMGEPGPGALLLRGEALRSVKRFREALVPLGQASEIMPENVHLWLAIGWCHKRIGRIDLAIEAIEKALEIDPDEALLHYNLACYLSLARRKQPALLHLARALEIDSAYRNLIPAESDFDSLRSDPEFLALTSVVA